MTRQLLPCQRASVRDTAPLAVIGKSRKIGISLSSLAPKPGMAS